MARRSTSATVAASHGTVAPEAGAPIVVLPDQLTCAVGPLAHITPGTNEVVLVESREWLSRRPYHVQRLALILAHMRAFAAELAASGHRVRFLRGDAPMADLLREHIGSGGSARAIAMEPAEREMRAELAPLVSEGSLQWVRNEMFLTTRAEFIASAGRPWKMESFYRAVRKRTGLLMEEDGSPRGGKLSFDSDNRKPWKGSPAAPIPPRFESPAEPQSREIRAAVRDDMAARFAHHPGTLDLDALPVTSSEVAAFWEWAKVECLPHFGPWEDAMSVRSRGLFHTRISPLLNIGRILARTLVDDAISLDLPLQCAEGFVRQVIGWREFVRHVHVETDGFRSGGFAREGDPAAAPGDGGYARWAGTSWRAHAPAPDGVDGGGRPAAFGQHSPLPPAYWGARSGMRCLDSVVADVWAESWSHHITRLMVLGNIATLLDVSPREVADWFWVAYADAWEWVVEPNVMGMAMFGAGGIMTTKPYVCGGAYVDRMSDYCGGCAFDPSSDCPVTSLYWAYLERHEKQLDSNPRMWVVLNSMRKRAESRRRADAARFVAVRDMLVRGERIDGALPGLS
jgi:deoxyribodipyrimidine photolyase-related protein